MKCRSNGSVLLVAHRRNSPFQISVSGFSPSFRFPVYRSWFIIISPPLLPLSYVGDGGCGSFLRLRGKRKKIKSSSSSSFLSVCGSGGRFSPCRQEELL